MSAETDDLELPDALRELRARFEVASTYPHLWALVTQGDVPAHRVGRRWRVKEADLPAIAGALRAVRRPKLVA
jgi:excisionase family DNA binding protein